MTPEKKEALYLIDCHKLSKGVIESALITAITCREEFDECFMKQRFDYWDGVIKEMNKIYDKIQSKR